MCQSISPWHEPVLKLIIVCNAKISQTLVKSPKTDQQEALIRESYSQVGLPLEETAFFAGHGKIFPRNWKSDKDSAYHNHTMTNSTINAS